MLGNSYMAGWLGWNGPSIIPLEGQIQAPLLESQYEYGTYIHMVVTEYIICHEYYVVRLKETLKMLMQSLPLGRAAAAAAKSLSRRAALRG